VQAFSKVAWVTLQIACAGEGTMAKTARTKKKPAKRRARPPSKPKKSPRKRATSASKKAPQPKRRLKAKPEVKKTKQKKKPSAGKKTARAKKTPGAKKTARAKKKPTAAKKTHRDAKNRRRARPKPEAQKPTPAAPKKPPRARMLPRDFLIELARAIRKAIVPTVREGKGREVVGSATSGDATFELDTIAEKALLAFLRHAKLPVAYYSEDSGYTTFTNAQPENLLVVDPIDGTRAAKSGFESCVISVASTQVIERPRMADIENALVMEILGTRIFYAERGKGARVYADGRSKRPRLSGNANLETISWTMTVPARPAELIFPTAAKLIDLSSLKGGFFACNSTAYSVTRLLTGQIDACVDFANRYLRDIPEAVQDYFINAGRGAVLGIAPYDLVAALLIAEEAGCSVTDAYGQSFDEVLILDSSVSNHRSLIATANPELHKKLLTFFDTRIGQYEQLLVHRTS